MPVGKAVRRAPFLKACFPIYEPQITDIIDMMRRAGLCDALVYEWVRKLAFNVYVGNGDAHSKNYSFILGPSGIGLSPLYDAVATWAWPQFDNSLAMSINDVWFPYELTFDDWAAQARMCGLDSGHVVEIAREMRESVLTHTEDAAQGMRSAVKGAFISVIRKANGL